MTEATSYTIEEVAGLLKVSKLTVYDLIKKGLISAYRVGRQMRVDEEDLKQYKANMRMSKEPSAVKEADPPRRPEPEKRRSVIISGQDVSMDLLSKQLEQKIQASPLRKYSGSLNSLIEMYRGACDIVSLHLYDGETGEYNIPYVKRILSGEPFVLFHVVLRQAGLYVKKGNPLNIQGFQDLSRKDVRIVNREKGSGARVLLDEQLRSFGITPSEVAGYHDIVTDHLSAASQVSGGKADAGIGSQHAAYMAGTDFIPVIREQYDVVVLKQNRELVQSVQDILNSEEFKSQLSQLSGYDTKMTGRLIYET
ncbi:substrate-binding domain-containing protein [Bacillus siamensis]|uniref:substrate-binding domain-containing protein n=1 Tax=Bacillus siamensis TaxID=659243 RepID=UPI0034584B34